MMQNPASRIQNQRPGYYNYRPKSTYLFARQVRATCVGFADVTRIRHESGVNLAHMSRKCYARIIRVICASCSPRTSCKCCAHLPREERATRDVTFGPPVNTLSPKSSKQRCLICYELGQERDFVIFQCFYGLFYFSHCTNDRNGITLRITGRMSITLYEQHLRLNVRAMFLSASLRYLIIKSGMFFFGSPVISIWFWNYGKNLGYLA
jgi:hypothetical protein